jgi:hypothetical protein
MNRTSLTFFNVATRFLQLNDSLLRSLAFVFHFLHLGGQITQRSSGIVLYNRKREKFYNYSVNGDGDFRLQKHAPLHAARYTSNV